MCEGASFVLKKEKCFWEKKHNSHRLILEANGIEDKKEIPDFVKLEITPPIKNGMLDYFAPFYEWIYKLDQDKFPDWYVPEIYEKIAREMLPAWFESHIIGQCTDSKQVTQTAGDASTQTAGVNSVQIGYWFEGSVYNSAVRKITKKEANKPYKFKMGVWTLLKK